MNTRRTLLVAIGATLLAAPRVALAQQKVWRIGVLLLRRPASLESDANYSAFVRGMSELGYVQGKNLVIEARFADARTERLPVLAAELVRLKVDAIVAAGNQPISAAQQSTSTIPIVIATAIDPVESGFVKSLAHPGGNITGLSNLTGELIAKHLEFMLSTVPNVSRVALLMNPTNSAHAGLLKNVQAAAQKVSVQVVPAQARSPAEFEPAFSSMTQQKVGAVIVAIDGLFSQHAGEIAALAARTRLPSIYTTRVYVEAGGLMSYGQNLADNYYRAAAYVDKILKGAKPADLPVEQSTKFEFLINGKTAKALGLKIPNSILVRADKVIE